jgi:hypothetical protein
MCHALATCHFGSRLLALGHSHPPLTTRKQPVRASDTAHSIWTHATSSYPPPEGCAGDTNRRYGTPPSAALRSHSTQKDAQGDTNRRYGTPPSATLRPHSTQKDAQGDTNRCYGTPPSATLGPHSTQKDAQGETNRRYGTPSATLPPHERAGTPRQQDHAAAQGRLFAPRPRFLLASL